MKRILLFLLISIIAGCTAWDGFWGDREIVFGKPRVHLFLYSDYSLDHQKYINALSNSGYEVILRSEDLPENQGTSFIIHSPGLNPNHFTEIDNIVEILKSVGVKRVNKYEYRLGNHSYSHMNVGVYLL